MTAERHRECSLRRTIPRILGPRAKTIPTPRLWHTLDQPLQPSSARLELDLSVSHALGVNVSPDEFIEHYDILVKEMIIIRGLTKE